MSGELAPYGVLAEFTAVDDLVAATRRAREAGYRRLDAYAPFYAPDVAEALGARPGPLRWLILAGAMIGLAAGYFVQYWTNVLLYPYNAGGRPLHSWPAFLPISILMMILLAVLVGALALCLFTRLPQLYHPVFNVPEFARAMEDRFFLCIEARDARFDPVETRRFLEEMRPAGVWDVPR